MRRHRKSLVEARAIRDAVNLRTLIHWSAQTQGAFTIGKDINNRWYVRVNRPGSHIVFTDSHHDISTIVDLAAHAVRQTPEYLQFGKDGDRNRGDHGAGQRKEQLLG